MEKRPGASPALLNGIGAPVASTRGRHLRLPHEPVPEALNCSEASSLLSTFSATFPLSGGRAARYTMPIPAPSDPTGDLVLGELCALSRAHAGLGQLEPSRRSVA